MTRKLFGTDGIRGNADSVLTPDLVRDIGRAVAHAVSSGVIGRAQKEGPPRFVIGRDTRVSGPKVQQAFIDGATTAGADVAIGGLLPTAGVAFLTGLLGFDAGIVISASHNPAQDNGIKLFGPGGWKLELEQEREIERFVAEGVPDADAAGSASDLPDAATAYIKHLEGMALHPLKGIRVVADCANGAASAIVPKTFERLGIDAVLLNAELDGVNINDNCGAMHPEIVAAAAKDHGSIGLTFDGDSDRVLMADENGRVVDGDAILAILAAEMRHEGALTGDALVATVMANQALRRWCHEQDLTLHEVAVGDRYVLEGMRGRKAMLGGEQSGHIIRMDRSTTGDGILVALAVLDAVAASGKTLAELVPFEPFPQVLINVKTPDRDAAAADERVVAACRDAEASLGDDGRVLVRPSGTEQLVRVMVEASDAAVAQQLAERVADVVRAL